MTLVFRRSCLAVVIAFLCQVLAISSTAQRREDDEFLKACPLPLRESPGPNSVQQVRGWLHCYLAVGRYANFIEYVGRENYQLQKQQRKVTDESDLPADYGALIGLSDSEAKVLTEDILAASPVVIQYWDRLDADDQQPTQRSAGTKGGSDDPELETLKDRMETLVIDTRNTLRNDMGEAALDKLDLFVYRNFPNRKEFSSSRQFASLKTETGDPHQLAIASKSSVGSARRSFTDAARLGAYQIYLQSLSPDSDSARQNPAKENDESIIILPLDIPKEKRNEVFKIAHEANLQYTKNWKEVYAVLGEYHEEFGPGPVVAPYPPDLIRLRQKFQSIITDTIEKLKLSLGDDDFKKFDKSVMDIFGD